MVKKRFVGFWLAIIGSVASLSSTASVHAEIKRWTNLHAGSWSASGNWSPSGVPDGDDWALFEEATSYTVYFSSVFQDLDSIILLAGTVTFERLVSPATLQVIGPGGDLAAAGATLNLGQSLPVNMTVGDDTIIEEDGTINVRVGSFLNMKRLLIHTGGTLTVDSGADVTSSFDMEVGSYGSGTLSIAGGGSVSSRDGFVGVSAGSYGAVTVSGAGSTWTSSDSVYVGGNKSSTGGAGRVSIRPGASVNVAANLVLYPDGLLELEGGTLVTNMLDDRGGALAWTSGTLHLTGAGGLTVVPGGVFASLLLNQTSTLIVDNALTINPGQALFARGGLSTGSTNVLAGGKLFVGSVLPDFGGGLVNNGAVVFTDVTTVDGPIANAGGAGITALADVTFLDLVTSSGAFFGAGAMTFNGGIQPGDSPATVSFASTIAFGSPNTLYIAIGGVAPGSQYDRVAITGSASLDGDVNVSLLNGFTPTLGDSFEFLTAAGGVSGAFANEILPMLRRELAWNVEYGATSVVLKVAAVPIIEADFDENNLVNGGDLVRWKTGFGTGTTHMQGDADADGDVDGSDFLVWQRQLSGSALSDRPSAAVPEPASGLLIAAITSVLLIRRVAVEAT